MGGSDAGRVFPQVSKIRDVSLNVAVAIGKVAVEAGMSKTYGVRPPPLARRFAHSLCIEVDSSRGLLIVPLFLGGSRFEILILSHH